MDARGDYDGAQNHRYTTGVNIYITMGEIKMPTITDVINLYETTMAMKHAVMEHAHDQSDAHLERYINNRNKRTGNTWRVVERYMTNGDGKRVTVYGYYDRAVIENEHGKRVRIWHDVSHWRVA
jgi:hypothetical protein